ncbi:hypothetical protein PHMEG_00022449 [Phytophthora megakarya]|uniref:VASt domain-containing protein n=1 Tax=Phytophthora megakarya TaxID=4795 RepID=A0A225VJF8_9STRA|nr:hypothetical protein PHMEG_00022449 [Phytophthora megakarya]
METVAAVAESMPKRSQSEQQFDATATTSLTHSKSESALQPKQEEQDTIEDSIDQEVGESDVLQALEQTHDHLQETSRAASCSSLSTSSGVGSASSAASLHRRASIQARANNPLRGDTSLKIFLPTDNLALKAILSPKNSSFKKEDETKTGEDTAGSSSNLIDKLLFRNGTSAPMTPKKSMGSVVEEDLEATNVVVMNTNLPPPPFANMETPLSKLWWIVLCRVYNENFQKQVKSTSVTWSGLQPPPNDKIVQDFELSEDESPVSIFNCALFLETKPFYGHLVLTRKRLCFESYVDNKRRKVAYSQIVSLLKPQFYYINGLQVKTKRKETFFLAEFNGLRDTCFLRLDQLIRAYQEASKLKGMGPGGKSPSSKELKKQALDRRRSYKLISEHIVSSVGTTGGSGNAPLSSSSPISTVGFIDVDDDEDANGEVPLSDIVEDGHDDKSTASDEEPFEPLPPDPLLEKMTVLLDCDMRADVKRVFDLLWNDGPGQEFSHANMEKARDIDIDIESWKAIDKNDATKAAEINKGFEISKEDDYTLFRIVRSQHPPKTSFPGLPPYAGCTRTQRFRLDKSSNGGDKWDRFVITELNRMSKIPFSDYFEVEMRYVFSRDGNNYCHVQVGLVVNFLKATWFKSQINSSTRSESKEALESWTKQAIEFLESQRNRVVPLSPTLRALSSGSFCELESEPSSSIHPVLKRRVSGANRLKTVDSPVAPPTESHTSSLVESVQPPRGIMQWLLLGLLLYGLILLRGHQMQMQQLTTATTKLLEHLQEQQSLMQTQVLRMQQNCEGPSVQAAMETLQGSWMPQTSTF